MQGQLYEPAGAHWQGLNGDAYAHAHMPMDVQNESSVLCVWTASSDPKAVLQL